MIAPGIADLISKWRQKGLGIQIWDQFSIFSILVWVDIMYILALSLESLQEQIYDVITLLDAMELTAKPSSLEAMADRHALPDPNDAEKLRTRPLEDPRGVPFTWMEEVEILGVMTDSEGSTAVALEHRLVTAQKLWAIHRKALCNPKVPLSKRLQRYYTIVVRSAMWGAGGWTLTNWIYSRCGVQLKGIFP